MANYSDFNGDELLKEREVAKLLQFSPRTLQKYRVTGGGPNFLKLGGGKRGSVRYRLSQVKEWAERHERNSTSQG